MTPHLSDNTRAFAAVAVLNGAEPSSLVASHFVEEATIVRDAQLACLVVERLALRVDFHHLEVEGLPAPEVAPGTAPRNWLLAVAPMDLIQWAEVITREWNGLPSTHVDRTWDPAEIAQDRLLVDEIAELVCIHVDCSKRLLRVGAAGPEVVPALAQELAA